MMPRSSRTKSCEEQPRGLEQLQTENKELRAERIGWAGAAAGRAEDQGGRAGLPPPHGPGVAQPGGTGRLWLRSHTGLRCLASAATLLRPAFTFSCPRSQVAHADQQLRDLGKFQ